MFSKKEGEKKRRTASEDLEAARKEFGSRPFTPEELYKFFKDLGVSKTTLKRRIQAWRDEGVLFAYESSKQDPNKLYSFDASSLPQEVRLDASKALEAAREHFGSQSFKSGELSDFLISRGMSKTKAKKLIKQWKEEEVLFAYQSEAGERDTNKDLSFDANSLPQGVRPVATGNRETYGYTNPSHTSLKGLAIIRKGLIIEEDPSSPTGYKYNYAPGKEYDLTYLQTLAHFRCARSGEIFQWRGDNLHKGHHEGMGASDHWNQRGHTQTKAENQAWNRNPANYHGPEMAIHSQTSGGRSEEYKPPSPEKGSHPMWWDPTHPNYAGD